ncbi:amidohydrolase family protein [Capillimicrobium parvum]|uniref:Amidohydrolase-related domain-containing protein n=1 Tax=Capillimicrobium parvum TaxID=2884022 RepID=A0A9E7BZG5_9ACTN|nr:amidohydrolase family protein [Capillimicrobium parvum]UGS35296.1 hypothetical protein DSM104329_01683 [Capillimicrobium parvum]
MTAPVDSDVHAAPPAVAELRPYLGDYWRSYVDECGFAGPAGLAVATPPNAPTAGVPGGGATLEALGQHLSSLGASHGVLHCPYGLEGLRNLEFASALATAVNDWLADQWLDHDDRLRATLLVKAEDAPGAVAEIERRAADPRFVGVLLPARSDRPYGQRAYFPVFEAAAAHGLPVVLHFGGCTGNPPTPVGWPTYYIEEYVGMVHAFEAQLTSLVAEGVLQRLADLRIVLAESGFTWLPSIMWRLDKEWKGLRREIPWVTTAPSALIRRQVRATVQPVDGPGDPARLRRAVEQLGSEEMLLFASDHPHRHAQHFEEALAGVLEPEHERAILRGNAVEVFGL